jgi:hypothetical protein
MNPKRWGGVFRGALAGAALLGLLAVRSSGCGGATPISQISTGGTGGSGGGGQTSPDAGPVDGGPDGRGPVAPHPPWTELVQPTLNLQGGVASSPGGQGRDGGLVHLVGKGDVSFDGTQPPIQAPVVPPAPGDAVAVSAGALAADVTLTGSASLGGNIASSGNDAVRTITVNGGDLFVSGTLRGADLGASRQGITLQATGGTVYVTGVVDSQGRADGQAGGAIRIVARQVVVTGKLLSSGADSATAGGAGGVISLKATDSVVVTGTVEAFGGNASGDGAVTGGAAGALSVQAGGDVAFGGTLRLRGGAATSTGAAAAQGGAAAPLTIDSEGVVSVGGILDGRGGMAVATGSGGAVTAGAAGAVHIGEGAPPAQIAILVPVAATGGDGPAAAGGGGHVTPEPDTGNVNIVGPRAIDVSGGGSLVKPGPGGLVDGGPRHDPGTGGIIVSGEVVASGGSILPGGSGNGADGGRVDFELAPTDGPVNVQASGVITVEGGKSGGAGVAGGGGHLWLFTKDGDITLAGEVSVRGGEAPDAGGTGGPGGMVYFFSDNNHNAVQVGKGDLLIAATGTIDASGGAGTTGGSARSDGASGTWPVFPAHQEEIAIFLNCDGEHGETLNWMDNQGHLIARGGVHGGNGGDIVFHGISPGQLNTPAPPPGNHHPLSGNVDMAGDGAGQAGDYGAE